ncbi:hypothetical protein ACLOJK_011912 [Asimina triloba]
MVPGNKNLHLLPPPPQPPPKNPNPPNTSAVENDVKPHSLSSQSKPALVVDGAEEDLSLRLSLSLTREEVLRRRSRRIKQLGRYYKSQYWALMDELKAQYRDYYWKYGKSPFKEGDDATGFDGEGSGENHSDFRSNGGSDGGMRKCASVGCKSKAMALTSYCHNHILSDSKQKLYKPCSYVIKSSMDGDAVDLKLLMFGCHRVFREARGVGNADCPLIARGGRKKVNQQTLLEWGPMLSWEAFIEILEIYFAQTGRVTCGKPVLRAAVPSLCTIHFQKAQRHVSQALKKAGLNCSSSSKPAPKFHVIIAEYIQQIQNKRIEAQNAAIVNDIIEDENGG